MGTFLSDIKYALRGLFSSSGFFAVSVLMLAIGVGSTTAITSLSHQVLLKPLPVSKPSRLMNLASPGPKPGWVTSNEAGPAAQVFSYPMFRDMQRNQEDLIELAAHRTVGVNLSLAEVQSSDLGVLVSGNYFSVLGVRPAIGRLLNSNDGQIEGRADSVVLSYGYWYNEFGGDPSVLGRSLIVNGRALTIVGVTPKGFYGTTPGNTPAVYVPITFQWLDSDNALPEYEDRSTYWVYVFGRLGSNVSSGEAQAFLTGFYRGILNDIEVPLQSGLSTEENAEFAGRPIILEPGDRGQSTAFESARLPLVLLFGISALLLLIVCVNIANLFFIRNVTKEGEFSLRASLGASPSRLSRIPGLEAGIVGIVGGLLAIPVSWWILHLITLYQPEFVSGFEIEFEFSTLLYASLFITAAILAFGLAPILKVSSAAPARLLNELSGRADGSREASRLRAGLTIAQISISMVLLSIAIMSIQSIVNINQTDLGVDADSVAVFTISPEQNGYSIEQSQNLFDRVETELASRPGITAVASSMVPLFSGSNWSSNVSVEGFKANPGGNNDASYNYIGSDFFDALGMQMLSGRTFRAKDNVDPPRTVIVNEEFAKHFDLTAPVIGKRMARGEADLLDLEIVGLVSNAKYDEVKADFVPQFYLARGANNASGTMNFYVKSNQKHELVVDAVNNVISQLDLNLPINNLQPLSLHIRESTQTDRFIGILAIMFGIVATVLVALGLYGLLTYNVAQRRKELALRTVFGAHPRDVYSSVFIFVTKITAVGAFIGIAVSLLVGLAAKSLFYQIHVGDLGILSLAAFLLIIVVCLSAYVPARRASKIEPAQVLRGN